MLLNAWLSGAIFVSAMVIAMFFYRFWRHSHERLFVYFAWAFALEGTHRVLQIWPSEHPDDPTHYLVRLAEYTLILIAIVQKNRKRKQPKVTPSSDVPGA